MNDLQFRDMTTSNKVTRPGFRGTPFAARTAMLNQNALWMHWDGKMVVDSYTDVASELAAIRTRVAMGDMSPLSKYLVHGPDAERLIDHMIPRDATRLRPGQIYYTPWCDADGRMIGDGLVFRLDKDTFRLSADPSLQWLKRHADGLDVDVTDTTDDHGILTLQGPRSREVLAAVTHPSLADLPFSRLVTTQIAGRTVEIARQGFTGEHGYEFWVKAEDALAVWDRVYEASQSYEAVPAGAWALDIARLEAGLLIVGYDYTSAGPDHGGAAIEASAEYHALPLELGLGRLIDFRKSDFLGKGALQRAASTSHRQLVGLDIDWQPAAGEADRRSAAPSNLRRVRWYPLQVQSNGVDIGHATSIAWAPSLRRMIGFGHLKPDFAKNGTVVSVQLPQDGSATELTARVCPLPFLGLRRAN